MRKDVDQKRIIQDIREFAEELGRAPSSTEFYDWSDYAVVRNRFGSWPNAIKASGLEPAPYVTHDEIIQDIQECADKLDKTPTFAEFDEWVDYSAGIAQSRFGRWSYAVMAAGLEPNKRGRESGTEPHTEEQIIDDIRRVVNELDGRLTFGEFLEHVDYSGGTVMNRFGTWTDALDAAGVKLTTIVEDD